MFSSRSFSQSSDSASRCEPTLPMEFFKDYLDPHDGTTPFEAGIDGNGKLYLKPLLKGGSDCFYGDNGPVQIRIESLTNKPYHMVSARINPDILPEIKAKSSADERKAALKEKIQQCFTAHNVDTSASPFSRKRLPLTISSGSVKPVHWGVSLKNYLGVDADGTQDIKVGGQAERCFDRQTFANGPLIAAHSSVQQDLQEIEDCSECYNKFQERLISGAFENVAEAIKIAELYLMEQKFDEFQEQVKNENNPESLNDSAEAGSFIDELNEYLWGKNGDKTDGLFSYYRESKSDKEKEAIERFLKKVEDGLAKKALPHFLNSHAYDAADEGGWIMNSISIVLNNEKVALNDTYEGVETKHGGWVEDHIEGPRQEWQNYLKIEDIRNNPNSPHIQEAQRETQRLFQEHQASVQRHHSWERSERRKVHCACAGLMCIGSFAQIQVPRFTSGAKMRQSVKCQNSQRQFSLSSNSRNQNLYNQLNNAYSSQTQYTDLVQMANSFQRGGGGSGGGGRDFYNGFGYSDDLYSPMLHGGLSGQQVQGGALWGPQGQIPIAGGQAPIPWNPQQYQMPPLQNPVLGMSSGMAPGVGSPWLRGPAPIEPNIFAHGPPPYAQPPQFNNWQNPSPLEPYGPGRGFQQQRAPASPGIVPSRQRGPAGWHDFNNI